MYKFDMKDGVFEKKRIFLLFNYVYVVLKYVWMYKYINVLNIVFLIFDFIFVYNYIILCDDWFLDYFMIY